MGKLWYRSRTILLNAAAALVMVAPEVIDLPLLAGAREELALAVAIANVILRFDTRDEVKLRRRPPPKE